MSILATNSFFHSIGEIFQPIFRAIGWVLAAIYGVVPNYAIAIMLLTLLIMLVLTPFTVKSTKSMIAMSRLQPEIKKLQQKYKGPEYRQELNEEMMKLYREEGVNPLGGCLPLLLQAPFLFILYNTIKGLSYKTSLGISAPRYIPASSKMYHNIAIAHGQLNSFGIDLSLKPFSHFTHWYDHIPFFVILALAVGLQYFQMAQINNRNKKTGQVIPSQQQTIQRIMPLLFAYIYFIIPAAVVLYMIVSTLVRIATQDILFRTGVTNVVVNPGNVVAKEQRLPAREKAAPTPPPKRQPSTVKRTPNTRSKAKRQRRTR